MPWYKEAAHWAEAHPYIAGAGVFAVGAVIVLLYESGSSPSAPALTFEQQMKLQHAQFAGQEGLINAQNRPAIAQVLGQTAQTRIQTSGQTTQTRIETAAQSLQDHMQANVQMFQDQLQSNDINTGYLFNQQNQQAQIAAQEYAEMLQWYEALLASGNGNAVPSGSNPPPPPAG